MNTNTLSRHGNVIKQTGYEKLRLINTEGLTELETLNSFLQETLHVRCKISSAEFNYLPERKRPLQVRYHNNPLKRVGFGDKIALELGDTTYQLTFKYVNLHIRVLSVTETLKPHEILSEEQLLQIAILYSKELLANVECHLSQGLVDYYRGNLMDLMARKNNVIFTTPPKQPKEKHQFHTEIGTVTIGHNGDSKFFVKVSKIKG